MKRILIILAAFVLLPLAGAQTNALPALPGIPPLPIVSTNI